MKQVEPYVYVLLRIISGFMFLCHGTQTLFWWPTKPLHINPNEILELTAGLLECGGGFLIAIGLFTRPAAFLCAGLMAVAYWMEHGLLHVLPIQNGGEFAVLYCFVFLLIWARGSGKFSVDRARENAKKN